MIQYKARIDIRVEGNRFNLSHVRVSGTLSQLQLFKADWLLSKDQNKHWVVKGNLGKMWGELCAEFVAGGTGDIRLEFRGDYFDDLDVNRHEIWLDDVELEGGVIINGSFEEIDKDNKSIGWGGVKTFNHENVKARTGKRCVLVWHDEPVVQKIAVVPGRRYRVSAWFKANAI